MEDELTGIMKMFDLSCKEKEETEIMLEDLNVRIKEYEKSLIGNIIG